MKKTSYSKLETINTFVQSFADVIGNLESPRADDQDQYSKNQQVDIIKNFMNTVVYGLRHADNKLNGNERYRGLADTVKFIQSSGRGADFQLEQKKQAELDIAIHQQNDMILSELYSALDKLHKQLFKVGHQAPAIRKAPTAIDKYAQEVANSNAGRLVTGEQTLTRAEMQDAIAELANTLNTRI